jgi:hypothetical protein
MSVAIAAGRSGRRHRGCTDSASSPSAPAALRHSTTLLSSHRPVSATDMAYRSPIHRDPLEVAPMLRCMRNQPGSWAIEAAMLALWGGIPSVTAAFRSRTKSFPSTASHSPPGDPTKADYYGSDSIGRPKVRELVAIGASRAGTRLIACLNSVQVRGHAGALAAAKAWQSRPRPISEMTCLAPIMAINAETGVLVASDTRTHGRHVGTAPVPSTMMAVLQRRQLR